MSVSVSGMNEASARIYTGAIFAAAGAWAASELLTPSPVGVLWGLSNFSAGAIFGATSYIVGVLVSKGLGEMLPLNDPNATKTAKVVASLAAALLGMVGGFFALKAIGITLTASVVVNLAASTFINGYLIFFGMECFCGDTNKQPANAVRSAPAARQASV